MKVLIVGFDNYNELDKTMNKLIEDSQFFLFNIICGGLEKTEETLAEKWAKNNGAPVLYFYEQNIDKLMWKLQKETDYIVIKITDKTPQIWKNFMMKLKSEGKHGTVVR